jgi:hypothetical protein
LKRLSWSDTKCCVRCFEEVHQWAGIGMWVVMSLGSSQCIAFVGGISVFTDDWTADVGKPRVWQDLFGRPWPLLLSAQWIVWWRSQVIFLWNRKDWIFEGWVCSLLRYGAIMLSLFVLPDMKNGIMGCLAFLFGCPLLRMSIGIFPAISRLCSFLP